MDSQQPDPDEPSWLQVSWDRLGLVLGPAAMLAWIFWGPSEHVTPEAHRLGGVLLLTIIWWLTEPIPIPATGLLAVVLAVIVGAVPGDRPPAVDRPRAVRQSHAVLSAGRHVHRPGHEPPWARSADCAFDPHRSGGRPFANTLLAAVGLSVMLISMWISNTAATAMIYPVTLGIIGVLSRAWILVERRFARSPYASALLLMTAYASSVGGIATPIGTTTNVVAMGYFRQSEFFGRSVDFGRWTLVGVPMMLVLGVALFAWLRFLTPRDTLDLSAVRTHLARERAGLGAGRAENATRWPCF